MVFQTKHHYYPHGMHFAETAHITLGKCTLIIYLCLCSRRVSCANYVRTVRQSRYVTIPMATVILRPNVNAVVTVLAIEHWLLWCGGHLKFSYRF